MASISAGFYGSIPTKGVGLHLGISRSISWDGEFPVPELDRDTQSRRLNNSLSALSVFGDDSLGIVHWGDWCCQRRAADPWRSCVAD